MTIPQLIEGFLSGTIAYANMTASQQIDLQLYALQGGFAGASSGARRGAEPGPLCAIVGPKIATRPAPSRPSLGDIWSSGNL